jgi:hypothetical protein
MKNALAISAVIFTIGFVTIPVVWSDDDHYWRGMDEYRNRSTAVTWRTPRLCYLPVPG